MDPGKLTAVLCLVVLLVVGINGALYLVARRGGPIRQIELFRRAAHAARHPWQAEEADLQELSRRVASLRDKGLQPKDPKAN